MGVDEITLPWTRELIVKAAWAHFGAIMGPFITEGAGAGADLPPPYSVDCATGAAAPDSFAGPAGLNDVGGAHVPRIESALTVPFNVIGRGPVSAVPSGTAPSGLPTGVQLLGRTPGFLLVCSALPGLAPAGRNHPLNPLH